MENYRRFIETCNSMQRYFIKLHQNAGALLFSNITLEVIEDSTLHANDLLAKWTLIVTTACRLGYSIF